MNNIKTQQSKIDLPIEIIDGINGDQLDFEQLLDSGIVQRDNYFRGEEKLKKREIGCYLSHMKIYEKIIFDDEPGYTIIFEDDFVIKTEILMQEIKDAITTLNNNNIEFHMLYLGNTFENHGQQINNNLFYKDKNDVLYGMQGYVVNNKNVHELYTILKPLIGPIDVRVTDNANDLTLVTFYPIIVHQGGSNNSLINDLNIELMTNYEMNVYK
jgi:glycosyl transferase family 25